MNIIQLKNKFFQEINNLYPKTEIESFFYLLTDAYLKLKRIDIALSPNLKISQNTEQQFTSAIAKLKQHEPIQYIIGKTEFYGLPFNVNKSVLIPRPETEELVDWVIEHVKNLNTKTISILDIGTGSGCIAISLAKKINKANIYALDISTKALDIAKKNATTNGVTIQFLNHDILKLEKLPQQFDIIVSNPPYVRNLEKKQMHNNVLKHEPKLALFVENNNPLLFYNKIALLAKDNLNKNGVLFFEINQFLGTETIDSLAQKGFQNIQLKKDFFKKDRMIKANLN